jgi:RNA polymerase sigma-70 factor, ECF subfamily
MGGDGAAKASSNELDERVRRLVRAGQPAEAATVALRALGPQILGYLSGVMGSEADADDVFASTSERVWRSLATFEWRCSLRTWFYVVAHREIARFRQRAKRHVEGRVRISELRSVLSEVRSTLSSTLGTERQRKIAKLRAELPEQDRALLVLRVDRDLSWEEIVLVVAEQEGEEELSEADTKREAARLRKRFQIVRDRLATRVREEKL